ncbi:hypothetical protein LPJ64_003913 [Coemansia asiatica]|uniref:Uncharacterized protein n=1 Tax=Coemansia asiatica TaxID=1052880 RepID=A0A9W8CJL0_9FUNG|nr:hypothetical protein LPJ64_003913 [Coemansia asiatica]
MHGLQGTNTLPKNDALEVRPKTNSPLSSSATSTVKPVQIDARFRPQGTTNVTASINRPQIMASRPPQRPHAPRPVLQPANTVASPARLTGGSVVPRPVLGNRPAAVSARPSSTDSQKSLEAPATPLKSASNSRPQQSLAKIGLPTSVSASASSAPAPSIPQKPAISNNKPVGDQGAGAGAGAAGTSSAITHKPLLAQVQVQPRMPTPLVEKQKLPTNVSAAMQGLQPGAHKRASPPHSIVQPPPLSASEPPRQKDASTVSNAAATSGTAPKQVTITAAVSKPSKATVETNVKKLMERIDQINAITKAVELLDGSGFDIKSHLNTTKFNSDAQRALVVAKRLFEMVVDGADKT